MGVFIGIENLGTLVQWNYECSGVVVWCSWFRQNSYDDAAPSFIWLLNLLESIFFQVMEMIIIFAHMGGKGFLLVKSSIMNYILSIYQGRRLLISERKAPSWSYILFVGWPLRNFDSWLIGYGHHRYSEGVFFMLQNTRVGNHLLVKCSFAYKVWSSFWSFPYLMGYVHIFAPLGFFLV